MTEEFQEFEVIFQDNIMKHEVDERNEEYDDFQNTNKLSKRKKQKQISNSVPVNIPKNLSRNNSCVKYVKNESDFLDDERDGEMVPPHIITGQRIAGKMMTFSVCTGYGRTLKGRDLSQAIFTEPREKMMDLQIQVVGLE